MLVPQGISVYLMRSIANLIHSNAKPVIVVTQFGPFTDGYIRRFYDQGLSAIKVLHVVSPQCGGSPSVLRFCQVLNRLSKCDYIFNNGETEMRIVYIFVFSQIRRQG